jgi:hypothetical protein
MSNREKQGAKFIVKLYNMLSYETSLKNILTWSTDGER